MYRYGGQYWGLQALCIYKLTIIKKSDPQLEFQYNPKTK